jgi:hypothetical protein
MLTLLTLLFLAPPVNAFQETLVQKVLADPTVFYVATGDTSSSYFIMAGTGADTRVIPLYRSTDGSNFSFWKNYDPSAQDFNYNYCHLWAPEINQKPDGTFILIFSGLRYSKNESCGSIDGVTLFNAQALTFDLNFLSPSVFYPNPLGGPQSYPKAGCIDGVTDRSHCENTLRIDSDFFVDPITKKQWIYYVWFGFDQAWNNISSFDSLESNTKFTNRRPANADEENIDEAPDVFYKAPYYYMIYSQGDFRNSYSLSYSYGKSLADLRQDSTTKTNPKRYPLLPAQFYPASGTNCGGYSGLPVRSAGGHSSTIEIDNKFYMYYHKTIFTYDNLGCHNFQYRDVYRTELNFLPDGRIKNLYDTYVQWNTFTGNEYSMDVKTFAGETIAPCQSAGELKGQAWTLLQGFCGSKKVDPNQIESLRVCAAKNGNWAKATCSDYTSLLGGDIKVEIPSDIVPDLHRDFNWEDLGSDIEYSFDAKDKVGKLYAPCLMPQALAGKTSLSFDGQCTSSKIDLAQLGQVRVCAAAGGQWNQAVCSEWTSTLPNLPPIALTWPIETKKDILFAWNSLGSGYSYSLDLEDELGKKFYPCVHAGIIGSQTSTTFKGQCYNAALPQEKVRAARLCAAKNGNWLSAKCSPLIKVNRVKRSYTLAP